VSNAPTTIGPDFIGLVPSLADPAYRAISRPSVSLLKKGAKSPAHLKAGMDGLGPQFSKEASDVGRLCHTAVLEPHLLASEFAISPKFDRRTKQGKAEAAAFDEGVGDRTVVTEDQFQLALAIRDSVLAHPLAASILEVGAAELSAFWDAVSEDGESIPAKGRLDWVVEDFEGGGPLIFDLKTCQDASAEDFPKSAGRFGYHLQAAFYSDGYRSITGERPRFIFGAVEKSAPFGVQLFEFDLAAIAKGRAAYQRALSAYSHGLRTGEWPNYPTDVVQMSLPPWIS
jgi:exodeoxyribonuclease VIII